MSLQSFYAQFLIQFYARVKTYVPEIRYMDIDLGQLELYDRDSGRPAVSFPCLLVDFIDTNYDQLSDQVQTGQPVFQLRLGFPPFSPSHSLAPTAINEDGLKYFELENKLYTALQGWDANGICQPLTRIKEGSEKRDDAIRVRVIHYNSFFHDHSAALHWDKAPRPLLQFEGQTIPQ